MFIFKFHSQTITKPTGMDTKHETMDTDDCYKGPLIPLMFIDLVHCVAVVAVNDESMFAWHVAGADLGLLFNKKLREMLNPVAVECADNKFNEYKEWVTTHDKVTVWMAGPEANDVAKAFGASADHVMQTKKGPVTVGFSDNGWVCVK